MENDLPTVPVSPRAVRRHHKNRMKAWARFVYRHMLRFAQGDPKLEQAAKIADHLSVCGCEMCRNPRRSKWRRSQGRTAKKVQAIADLHDSLRQPDT